MTEKKKSTKKKSSFETCKALLKDLTVDEVKQLEALVVGIRLRNGN